MDQGEKGRFELKWPWNWLVCGVLIVAAWQFLGIFSLLLAALFSWWQKKRHPQAVPQGGYCLDRTRKRLARLLWALFYLLFSASGGVVLYMQLQEDRSLWEIKDWAFTVFSAVLCLGCAVLALIETYMDLRDAFFPARSRLAKSIRAQLPYPEEAPPVEELFAMVDRDIRENGQWFDRVAIGREWVLGDDVTSIARIRGVFLRDEIKTRYNGERRNTTRIMELWIVDDRRQVQCTSLRRPNELKAAVDCLRLRAPEALFDSYSRMHSFTGQSEEEWQTAERSYLRRRDQRLAQKAEETRYSAGSSKDFVLLDLAGRRTSRFDLRTVADQLAGLKGQGAHFSLEPTETIPAPGQGGASFARLECGMTAAGLTLAAVLRTPEGSYRTLVRQVDEGEARQVCSNLLERRQIPDMAGWQPFQAAEQPRRQSQARLSLSDRAGAAREYTSFTRRDVELAGEGLASGRYTVAALFAGPRYLYLKGGDQMDGRVTANASRPDPDMLRVFETRCTSRQAQQWLLQMFEGTFDPDFSQWKDVTKQLEKQAKQ